jgi:hypothetical protein
MADSLQLYWRSVEIRPPRRGKLQTNIIYAEEKPSYSCNVHEPLKHERQGVKNGNEPADRDCMFCGCGVGSYRGKQSVGSNGDTCAYAKSNAYTTASSNTCAASY